MKEGNFKLKSAITNKKDIKLAKFAGFCYGVKRAVEEAIRVKKENPDTPVYVLGQLIHNNQVTQQLEDLGIHSIEKLPEKLDGTSCNHSKGGKATFSGSSFLLRDGVCIIRTHGVSPQTIAEIEEKGCQVVDLTCPDVKRVQDKATSLAQEGYKVIVTGKPDHPEVMAIKAHADQYSESFVISSKQEAEEFIPKIREFKKIGVVTQTTQLNENFKEIIAVIAEHSKELKIYNTICDATCKRQKAAKELADNVDLMIVAGSKTSANTTHLAEILKPIKTTIHIETKDDLKAYADIISKTHKIGVTAGASTPDLVINEVIEEIGETK